VLEACAGLGLPFDTATFDKALSVNSIQIWPDPVAGLRAMHRVLKPGGRAVLVVQSVWDKLPAALRSLVDRLSDQLAQAGFQHIGVERTTATKDPTIPVTGVK
jgi:SAM-dependent methyltransferase